MIQCLDHPVFQKLAEVARNTQMHAWVVGGFVRDAVLGIPTKDIDVVVLGNGVEFATEFAKMLDEDKQIAVFKNFGTAQIKTRDHIIEIIGARKESYSRETRKPAVEEGTLEDDQNRRDFTINSLYLSLNQNDFGEMLDPFNGIQDIQDKIIRTPREPEITFNDDPLRMMRAIRFATRLNYRIEESTWEAIKKYAGRIEIVSQERISEELNGIIMCDKPGRGLELMFDCGLLQEVLPELAAMQGVEVREGKSHKDNFYHTLQVLDQISEMTDSLWLRWAAILHDIAKPATKRFEPGEGWTFHGHEDKGSRMVHGIFRRMRLPLDDKMKFVSNLVALHLRPIVLGQEKVTDSAVRRLIVDAGEDLPSLMLLCQADITSKNEKKVQRHLANLKLVQEKIDDLIERDKLRNWQPPVTGNHILENFEIENPKLIGTLKNEVREAIIEGVVANNLDDALSFMIKKGKELGLKPKNGSD